MADTQPKTRYVPSYWRGAAGLLRRGLRVIGGQAWLSEAECQTAQRFLLGLRLAAMVIAAVVLYTLGLPNLIRSFLTYRVPWVQVCCLVTYTTVVGLAAYLVLRGKRWGWLRWAALAATLGASIASDLSLGDGYAITAADWSFGSVGWVGVIVLTERPLCELLAFLGVHELLSLCTVVLTGNGHCTEILWLATASITSIGFPVAGAIAITALRFIANAADEAFQQSETVRVAEAVAAGLHERRRQRFASLYVTAVPLLRGLADRCLDPEQANVQRQCAIEAARMRRLFAELDTVANPLLHELRHCADVADRKGILVEMEGRGQWPEPPLPIRRALTEAPLAALATAISWARVTVIGTPGLLSVNVVADCAPVDLPHPDSDAVQLTTITEHDTLWVEVRWQTNLSPR
ncbi:MAG TPA: hypothetical protein VGX25_01555 [Actinophytocola sp.]|uniref:hypothetical protein n=1 Tax=Actinophytocola sp. TaxID=1872138 RepID=UPI002DDDB069|nr:hypothetical protein [Actinophytocola sp.]HEV2778063.1 hypothetical protein [Actinophytocola sp.]